MKREPVGRKNLLFPEMAGTVKDASAATGTDRALQRYLKRVSAAALRWFPPLTRNRRNYLDDYFPRR